MVQYHVKFSGVTHQRCAEAHFIAVQSELRVCLDRFTLNAAQIEPLTAAFDRVALHFVLQKLVRMQVQICTVRAAVEKRRRLTEAHHDGRRNRPALMRRKIEGCVVWHLRENIVKILL